MRGEATHKHFASAACIFKDRLWLFSGRNKHDVKSDPAHGHVESYDIIRQEWKLEPDVGHTLMKATQFNALVIPERSQVWQIRSDNQEGGCLGEGERGGTSPLEALMNKRNLKDVKGILSRDLTDLACRVLLFTSAKSLLIHTYSVHLTTI